MDLVRLPDATRQLGVSYPTLKQWIYKGKIHTVKTPGGHHRIPRAEINRLLFQGRAGGLVSERAHDGASTRHPPLESAEITGLEHIISGRNQLVGRITALETVGLLAKVVLDIGGQSITAIITRDASKDLRLKVGESAAALIKATEVMIIRPPGRSS
ncbi:MAG TPA: helix-turn-helix transcriptional regulator [Terriglobia bacterium]|jgi:molybdopterin-binding protein|nr:helix-turn-helix transcriptional regulator [Terriglobia bacterium]